jgi:hypothetical protein
VERSLRAVNHVQQSEDSLQPGSCSLLERGTKLLEEAHDSLDTFLQMLAMSTSTPVSVIRKDALDCGRTGRHLQGVQCGMSSTSSVQRAQLNRGPEEAELEGESSQEVLQQLQEDLVLDPDDIAGTCASDSLEVLGSVSDGCVKCGEEGRVVTANNATVGVFTERDVTRSKDEIAVEPHSIQSTNLRRPCSKSDTLLTNHPPYQAGVSTSNYLRTVHHSPTSGIHPPVTDCSPPVDLVSTVHLVGNSLRVKWYLLMQWAQMMWMEGE